MDLLKKSIELYLGVKAAKPRTDPMYLQIRDYIRNHFAYLGTRALAAADELPIVYTYKGNPSGNQRMQAWQHPTNVNKRLPAAQTTDENSVLTELQTEYADIGRRITESKTGDPQIPYLIRAAIIIKTQIRALSVTDAPQTAPAKTVQQSGVLAAQAAQRQAAQTDAGKKSQHLQPGSPNEKSVVAGDNSATTNEIQAIDVDRVRDMRAKAITQLYNVETLKNYLTSVGITTTGNESHTQLAGLVLHHVKA